VDYVEEGKAKKKIKDKRIVVIGNYRIFIFGRGKNVRSKVEITFAPVIFADERAPFL
jgi:hypothetical protein